MGFWTELAFTMTTTSRWMKWRKRFKTSRVGVPVMSVKTDGEEDVVVAKTLQRRGGRGGGKDTAAASRYTRTGETTATSIEALVIDTSAPLGHLTNPIGPDLGVLMER
jgi:hypothetical protein